jgi:hypothetical protein
VVDNSNSAFKSIQWSSDVGIFWTWGQYVLSGFDYLTNKQFEDISSENLYDNWGRARRGMPIARVSRGSDGFTFIFS